MINKGSRNRIKNLALALMLPLALVLALLLNACGGGTKTAEPGITASIQLPPTQVVTGDTAPPVTTVASTTAGGATTSATVTAAVPATTAILTPEATSTPVIAAALTATASVTATASATATANATATVAAATPTTSPTPTPTPTGALEPVDREAELKLVKTAYDSINKHLFKEPDNAALLEAALAEVGRVSGVAVPEHKFTKDQESNWNVFVQAFNAMLDRAKDFKYSRNQLAWRAINAMALEVGDEHTYFMDQASYQARQNLFTGNNTSIGFGVVITTQEGKAFVARVVGGGPADKAGLKAGDQLVRYDDQELTDKNWQIIRSAAENETHRFVIKRLGQPKGQPDLLTFNITKQKYNLPTVEYRLINGHIGYIGIRDFFLNVADEVDKAMVSLHRQGADSWIIDVRENPGGINVERVAGRFIPGGQIMGYTINREKREAMKVSNELSGGNNNGKPFSPSLPLVLLMDEVSASSSEILALTVRDYKLGPLIGTKTAGALGHTAAYPLGDGSAISVTIDEYESKSGERVNGVGVTPDIKVERTIADIVANQDPQLKAGVEYLDKILAKK